MSYSDRTKSYLYIGYALVSIALIGYIVYLLIYGDWSNDPAPAKSTSDKTNKLTPEELAKKRQAAYDKSAQKIAAKNNTRQDAVRAASWAKLVKSMPVNTLKEHYNKTDSPFKKRDILNELSKRGGGDGALFLAKTYPETRDRFLREEIKKQLKSKPKAELQKCLQVGSIAERKAGATTLWRLGYLKEDDVSDILGLGGADNKESSVTETQPIATPTSIEEVREILKSSSSGRSNPESAIQSLLGVLKTGNSSMYEEVTVAIKSLSREKDFPILDSSTSPEKAAKVYGEWQSKLIKKIVKE